MALTKVIGQGIDNVTVDSSGNVGIGVTSPAKKLHLTNTQPTTVSATNIMLEGGTTGYGAGVAFGSRTSSGGTLVEMAKITADGEAPFTTTVSTQDAGLRFFTAEDGSLSERMRITSGGNLLVGTTSTFGSLAGITSASNFVVGTSSQYWKTTNFSSTYYFNFNGSDKATISGSNGAYTALSDRNKKKDFEESTLGLSEVLRLQPTMFRMSSDDASAPLQLGFIAQDVADVIPQAYVEQEAPDGTFIGLQDRPIIAVLTKAIQEQQETITALEARIAALETA